jgi:predicted AlkP superfamily phosphohydrolase/phosphomutase
MKTVVIGIDGGSLELVRRWRDEGHLPHIGRLMERGIYGDLETIFPPLTGPAWVSFMTGVNPGKHGVFDFMTQQVQEGIHIISSESIRVPTLWSLLGAGGRKSVVVNVPITYPPAPIEGWMLTGVLSGKGDLTHPPGLLGEIESAIGRKYRTSLQVGPQLGREEDYMADFIDWHRSIEAASLYLLESKPWDFYMTVFNITDGFSHFFWRNMEEGRAFGDGIRKAYSLVDESIGKILDRVGEEANVILMSDHGFGPLRKMVNLNLYLMERGYVALKRRSLPKAFLFRHGLTANNLYRVLHRFRVAHMVKRVPMQTQSRFLDRLLSYDDVDWRQTLAYSRGHVGQVYLNPVGIEAQGLDYFDVRERLIGDLHDMTDPATGERIVDRVLRRDEIYWGRYADRGPELFIIMKNFAYLCYPLFAADNRLITDHIMKHRTGTHRMNGLFAAAGPDVPKRGEIEGARIFDVAPTILEMMGVGVPAHMDGRNLVRGPEPGA